MWVLDAVTGILKFIGDVLGSAPANRGSGSSSSQKTTPEEGSASEEKEEPNIEEKETPKEPDADQEKSDERIKGVAVASGVQGFLFGAGKGLFDLMTLPTQAAWSFYKDKMQGNAFFKYIAGPILLAGSLLGSAALSFVLVTTPPGHAALIAAGSIGAAVGAATFAKESQRTGKFVAYHPFPENYLIKPLKNLAVKIKNGCVKLYNWAASIPVLAKTGQFLADCLWSSRSAPVTPPEEKALTPGGAGKVAAAAFTGAVTGFLKGGLDMLKWPYDAAAGLGDAAAAPIKRALGEDSKLAKGVQGFFRLVGLAANAVWGFALLSNPWGATALLSGCIAGAVVGAGNHAKIARETGNIPVLPPPPRWDNSLLRPLTNIPDSAKKAFAPASEEQERTRIEAIAQEKSLRWSAEAAAPKPQPEPAPGKKATPPSAASKEKKHAPSTPPSATPLQPEDDTHMKASQKVKPPGNGRPPVQHVGGHNHPLLTPPSLDTQTDPGYRRIGYDSPQKCKQEMEAFMGGKAPEVPTSGVQRATQQQLSTFVSKDQETKAAWVTEVVQSDPSSFGVQGSLRVKKGDKQDFHLIAKQVVEEYKATLAKGTAGRADGSPPTFVLTKSKNPKINEAFADCCALAGLNFALRADKTATPVPAGTKMSKDQLTALESRLSELSKPAAPSPPDEHKTLSI